MRYTVLTFAAAAIFQLPAGAQPSVLIEACNGIQDSARRLECLHEATKEQPQRELADAKLKDTVLGLQGALDAGVSYRQYEGLVLDLSKELAVFKAKAPPAEAVTQLEAALQAYTDAGQFWLASIRYGAGQRNLFINGAVLPEVDLQMNGLAYLAGKYSIPLSKTDAFGLGAGLDRGTALTTIWARAKELSSRAFELLEKPAAPTTAPGELSS